jgi:hypothetical protein
LLTFPISRFTPLPPQQDTLEVPTYFKPGLNCRVGILHVNDRKICQVLSIKFPELFSLSVSLASICRWILPFYLLKNVFILVVLLKSTCALYSVFCCQLYLLSTSKILPGFHFCYWEFCTLSVCIGNQIFPVCFYYHLIFCNILQL